MNYTNEIIVCECGSPEHQVLLTQIPYDDDYLNKCYAPHLHEELKDEMFIRIHLCKRPFWQRVKYGIKYIFGYKSKYGAFDEIITSKKEFQQKLK